MTYTQEMNLTSSSGYCMPFEERDRDVQLTLGYGKQNHPKTGEEFFHHGIDFNTNNYFLAAVADGIVSGIGIDRKKYGLYETIKYGKYEVTYSHLSNVFVQFGQKVKAGLAVGVSSDMKQGSCQKRESVKTVEIHHRLPRGSSALCIPGKSPLHKQYHHALQQCENMVRKRKGSA